MNTLKYRKRYQEELKNSDNLLDLDFIGCYHRDTNNSIIKKGFIQLVHGDKENIKNFIESQVKIAEDGQAIYEFLQNAVDANSTIFSVYYDNENFLVVNNGKKFNFDNTKSILNFSQSTKTEEDEKIGKFGVGFKLIHRLVGNDSGIEEIIEDYKGPILFSWDDFYIKKFLLNDFRDIDRHWLYKIIYTSFPCAVDEKIKNELYQPIKPFTNNDLKEMIDFIKAQHIDLKDLESGSLFFLKLGKEKQKVLNRETDDLKTGISTSLNILNYLRKEKQGIKNITINNNNIKSDNLCLLSNNEYIFLYPPLEYAQSYYKDIDEKISFFKFFPMGDQTNKLNFIIHHYKFEVETNRRKLQKDGEINKKILKDIWDDLELKLNILKEENKEEDFVGILASLYLSDLKNANNKDFLIINNFTNYALHYIIHTIPYKYTNIYGIDTFETTNDKSKIVIIDSILHEIPLQNQYHFYFDPKKYKDIAREATRKLGLTRWSIVDAMVSDNINSWILELNDNHFNKLLSEIKEKKKLNSQKIIDIWKDSYSLNHIKRILQIFNVLDDNISFAVLKNKKNNYEIIATSKNHFIKNNTFKEFLENNYELYQMEYYLIPKELEDEITQIIGKTTYDKEIIEYLLDEDRHKEVINFVEGFEVEAKFLSTLNRLDIDTSNKYNDTSYELKVLNFILKYEDTLEENKRKIFINDEQISQLSKSPYITFTYQSKISSKVINPNSYDSDEKNSKEIVEFIEGIGNKYTSIFHIQEESKDIVFEKMKNDISANYKLQNRINTKNRLKFILLYSLEKGQNYIIDFNGISIFNREEQIDESIFRVYKILKNDIKVKDEEQFNIFNISDFFPKIFNKEYYIEDSNLAIIDEKLPNEVDVNYVEVFKKIGLVIDVNLPKFRKKLIEKNDISIDDFKIFKSIHLINTCKFIQVKNLEFNLANNDTKNIEKLFKMLDDNEKINLEYFPILKTKSSLIFEKIGQHDNNKYYILKETLKSTNEEFHKRLQHEIENNNIIYLDVLDLDDIPLFWKEIKENDEELKKEAKNNIIDELDGLNAELKSKTEYNDKTAEIGRKGELLVKKILIDKFGPKRVIDNNENGEIRKIDFEILDENLQKIIQRVEVKATIKSPHNSSNKDLTLIFSSEQFKHAQKHGSDTHLIFVTGVNDDKPEFLYMNFDNSWLN